MRNYIATLNNMVFVPPGSIYRGSKKFDFIVDDDTLPDTVKEKLKEVNEASAIIFKKGSESTKTRTERKKDGEPEGKGKPPKERR
jgi:hypothetical protein